MTDLSLIARLAELEKSLGSEQLLARLLELDGAGNPASPPVERRSGARREDGRAWGTPRRKTKRGKKGWELRPVLSDGSRPRIWAPTQDELWDDLKRRETAIRNPAGENPPASYDELCDQELEVYAHRESSKKTLEYNLTPSRREFGPRDPASITRFEIEKWLKRLANDPSERTKQPLSPHTRSNYLKAFSHTLDFAVAHDWLDKNRAFGLSVEVGECEPQPFDSWEQMFEVAHAFTRMGWVVGSRITRFAGGLGLRLQEVLVARECDLDREKGTFHVQRTWDDTLRCEVEATKTFGSNAILNLTPISAEVVEEIPFRGPNDPADWRHSPLLFTRPDGKPISPDYFRNKWAEAMALVPHIPYRPPKHLRHNFATLTLLALGVEKVKIVADLMRHDSSRTTVRHYIKKVQEMNRKNAAAAAASMPSYRDFLTTPTPPPPRP